MQQKQLNNTIKTLKACLLFIVIFLSLAWGIWAYDNVFFPSYVSVMSACEIKSAESFGYTTQGTFSFGFENESMNGINIVMPKDTFNNEFNNNYLRNQYTNTKQYHRTVRHEEIHRWQHNHFPQTLSCDHKILKYFTEVHAYIGMYF